MRRIWGCSVRDTIAQVRLQRSGHSAPQARSRVLLYPGERGCGQGSRDARAHQRPGHSSGIGRRVDLSLATRPYPGARHRQGRTPPIPLPRGVASAARPAEVRTCPRLRSLASADSSSSAEENETFGIATLRRSHVRFVDNDGDRPRLRGGVRARAPGRLRAPSPLPVSADRRSGGQQATRLAKAGRLPSVRGERTSRMLIPGVGFQKRGWWRMSSPPSTSAFRRSPAHARANHPGSPVPSAPVHGAWEGT
jgi:hypothetical protein